MKLLSFCLVLTSMLSLLSAQPSDSTPSAKSARVAFAQYCFWTGEMKLGQIDGVVRTEAGYFEGREVTLVDYDPARISLKQLAARAKEAGVADRLHLPAGSQASGSDVSGVRVGAVLDESYRIAPASDQKKQLEGTPYARLNLSPEQATKVNAFVRVSPAKAIQWLSAEQKARLAATR